MNLIAMRNTFLALFLLIISYQLNAGGFNEKKFPTTGKPGYNITASDTHQYIWFRVAKTGTRSTLDILRKNTKLSVNGYNIKYNPKDYRDHFKFSFCRNPWERVVSAYHNKVVTKEDKRLQECFDKSFEYFVDFIDRQDLTRGDFHIRLQTTLMPVEEVDFIGRFENFEEDLKLILFALGLEGVDIPHKNKSKHDHYSKYYTERTKEIITRKYKDDIEAFGYDFETK